MDELLKGFRDYIGWIEDGFAHKDCVHVNVESLIEVREYLYMYIKKGRKFNVIKSVTHPIKFQLNCLQPHNMAILEVRLEHIQMELQIIYGEFLKCSFQILEFLLNGFLLFLHISRHFHGLGFLSRFLGDFAILLIVLSIILACNTPKIRNCSGVSI